MHSHRLLLENFGREFWHFASRGTFKQHDTEEENTDNMLIARLERL